MFSIFFSAASFILISICLSCSSDKNSELVIIIFGEYLDKYRQSKKILDKMLNSYNINGIDKSYLVIDYEKYADEEGKFQKYGSKKPGTL
mgnify:CR=1 FL=1